MLKFTLKFMVLCIVSAVYVWGVNVGLGYVSVFWTDTSMDSVRDNMGDQVAIQARADAVGLVWWAIVIVSALVFILFWYFMFRREFKVLFSVMVIPMILLTGCAETKVVVITPPNYAIVINLKTPTSQATGNDFSNGELMNVTKVEVVLDYCKWNSNDICADKLIAEVEGSPISRIYSKDSNSGTSGQNQAMCFEANGANGCIDFSITAIIKREDAKCYANKMGLKPVMEGDVPSRFHFFATHLSEALDTRVLQISSSQFAGQVVNNSPLALANLKFEDFDEVRPRIITNVHDQTCITILDIAINNGIQWDSKDIQDQINQATIVANQLGLVQQQNDLKEKELKGYMDRIDMLKQAYGLPYAVELMRINKWSGNYITPFVPSAIISSTVVTSTN